MPCHAQDKLAITIAITARNHPMRDFNMWFFHAPNFGTSGAQVLQLKFALYDMHISSFEDDSGDQVLGWF